MICLKKMLNVGTLVPFLEELLLKITSVLLKPII